MFYDVRDNTFRRLSEKEILNIVRIKSIIRVECYLRKYVALKYAK